MRIERGILVGVLAKNANHDKALVEACFLGSSPILVFFLYILIIHRGYHFIPPPSPPGPHGGGGGSGPHGAGARRPTAGGRGPHGGGGGPSSTVQAPRAPRRSALPLAMFLFKRLPKTSKYPKVATHIFGIMVSQTNKTRKKASSKKDCIFQEWQPRFKGRLFKKVYISYKDIQPAYSIRYLTHID